MKLVPSSKYKDVPEWRVVNKAKVAEFFAVTHPTVDRWVRMGMPVRQEGKKGVAWELDLLEVAAWHFGGGESGSPSSDVDRMTPRERLDHFKALREEERHKQEMGLLTPTSEYERALASALKAVAVGLESLPDVLERDAGLDGAAIERAQAVVDRMREDLYSRVVSSDD